MPITSSHRMMIKERWLTRLAVHVEMLLLVLLLAQLGTQLFDLGSQDGILPSSLVHGLFQLADVVDGSRQCLPFTGLVGLGLRKTHPERLETVLHLAAALSFRQFVRHPQLRRPAVRGAARVGFGLADQSADLLVL